MRKYAITTATNLALQMNTALAPPVVAIPAMTTSNSGVANHWQATLHDAGWAQLTCMPQ